MNVGWVGEYRVTEWGVYGADVSEWQCGLLHLMSGFFFNNHCVLSVTWLPFCSSSTAKCRFLF